MMDPKRLISRTEGNALATRIKASVRQDDKDGAGGIKTGIPNVIFTYLLFVDGHIVVPFDFRKLHILHFTAGTTKMSGENVLLTGSEKRQCVQS